MTNLKVIVLRIVFIGFCFGYFAQPASALTFGLAPGYRYVDYAEKLTSPLKSTQYGFLPSFLGYVEMMPPTMDYFFKASVDYAHGTLTYDGTTQPPDVEPVTSTDFHSFLVYEAQLGVGLGSWVGETETFLYVGMSYRVWDRDISNPVETYHLLTVPVGIRFEPRMPHSLSVGFDLSFRTMIRGNVGVVFADTYDASTVPVKRDYGVRAEIPITLIGGRSFRLIGTPWFELSKIKQGDPRTLTSNGSPAMRGGQELQILEPSSRTYQYGATLGIELNL